jgi:Tol biopolymer transport system component
VAAFDRSTGVLTPKSVGTTTLTARLPGIRPAVWTIQVVAGEITVEPSRVGLLVAQRTTLSAILREPDAPTGARTPSARWSSDNTEVATVRENGLVDAVGLGHAVITATMPWGKKSAADIFVVGDLLLSSNRGGKFGVYQMRVPGPTVLYPILTDSANNLQAVLSPDRTRVALSSNRNGSFDLYLMDPDGGRLGRVTSSPANEGDPAWTPDGNRLIYTVTSGTNTQIAIVSVEGSENRQLTIGTGGNHSPSVAPDGRTIAFVSARDGNHAIYTMGIDGSNQRRITRGSARETSPRYARNGDLFYVLERGGGSRGSRIMRIAAASGSSSQVLQTEDPISSIAVSRDGDRLAYVTGRGRDTSKGRAEFSLLIQPLQAGRPPVTVPLQPGEQISSPSF